MTYRTLAVSLFDLHHICRILAFSLFRFTSYLQDIGSLPFLIYMTFTLRILILTVSFFYLHDIYRILAVSLFRFTWCLQDVDSLPFSIYMIFTGCWQSPFFDLHDIYRIWTVSLFRFRCLHAGCWQSPFFDLHDIHRILTALFSISMLFIDFNSSLFWVYMIFTGYLFIIVF